MHNINNIADFLQQGKESIIDLAVHELINDNSFQNFDINLFDKINIYYDKEYVWASFSQTVKYIPWNSAFIYSITVFLYGNEGGMSYSLLNNPDDLDARRPYSFYQHSDSDRKTLVDILKSSKIDPDNSIYETITIYDKPEYYDIEIMTESSGEFYKIRKSDMTIYDEGHEDLDMPEEDDTMELK